MKYFVLVILLLAASAASAEADTDTWGNTLKGGQGRDAAVDADYCTQTVGQDRNGHPTPPAFKRCMASRGWRLLSSTYDKPSREKTWIDPDTGDTCHEILNGLGSECSNY